MSSQDEFLCPGIPIFQECGRFIDRIDEFPFDPKFSPTLTAQRRQNPDQVRL